MRVNILAAALPTAAIVMLPACTINAPSREAPALYDLGGSSAVAPHQLRIPGTLMVTAVGSAAWLDTTGIVYRLNYEDPNRLHAYNFSRWVATPAMLLTQELRRRFAGSVERVVSAVDGAQADHALKVELEDYTQYFEAPDRSRVGLRARASLIDTRTRAIVAQRAFSAERGAPPNAAGAVAALAQCSAEFIENLLDWVAQNLKNSSAASTAERSAR